MHTVMHSVLMLPYSFVKLSLFLMDVAQQATRVEDKN